MLADGRRPQQRLIVASDINLGHSLGRTLIAEGVETVQALAALSGYGCDSPRDTTCPDPVIAPDFDTWRAPPTGDAPTRGLIACPNAVLESEGLRVATGAVKLGAGSPHPAYARLCTDVA